ncbi:MAG: hypothetical protein KAV41_01205 [Candidatus Pacebacteria bacterium]|nr:hypothetical protein [Candidatus Paceibacterota bacterium]
MKILLHKKFDKKFKKLNEGEKRKFIERRNLFLKNQFDSILNNHSLHGPLKGFRSINITGDLRAVFQEIGKDVFLFVKIDTHNNLYSE